MEGTEPRQQQPPTPGAFLSPPVAPEGYTFTTIPPSSFPTTFDDEDEHKEYHSLGRAGLDTKPRLIFMTGLGSFWGFCMGSFLGGRQSGLQYLAENAHRLPTTVQGWYFYHKTKNYRVMLGGIKRGMQYAGRTGGLCLLYGTIEAGYDRIRGEADILNSLSAGVTTGLLFSAMTKLTRGSVRSSVLFGTVFGFAAGSLSDLHQTIAGHPPTYIRKITSRFHDEQK